MVLAEFDPNGLHYNTCRQGLPHYSTVGMQDHMGHDTSAQMSGGVRCGVGTGLWSTTQYTNDYTSCQLITHTHAHTTHRHTHTHTHTHTTHTHTQTPCHISLHCLHSRTSVAQTGRQCRNGPHRELHIYSMTVEERGGEGEWMGGEEGGEWMGGEGKGGEGRGGGRQNIGTTVFSCQSQTVVCD